MRFHRANGLVAVARLRGNIDSNHCRLRWRVSAGFREDCDNAIAKHFRDVQIKDKISARRFVSTLLALHSRLFVLNRFSGRCFDDRIPERVPEDDRCVVGGVSVLFTVVLTG